jgi:serine/threonine protein phosphatase 1
MAALAKVKFDFSRDRLFSTGDLSDRGPESLACLRLVLEPWFYAVAGNHEDMLLSWLSCRTRFPSEEILKIGGHWLLSLSNRDWDELELDIAPALHALPAVRTVSHPAGTFHVVHSELMYGEVLRDDRLSTLHWPTRISHLMWGRRLARQATGRPALLNRSAALWFHTEAAWEPGLSLTYAGHTIMNRPTLYRSHLFFDCGAFLTRENQGHLCLLEHQQVMAQLPPRPSEAAESSGWFSKLKK